MAALRRFLSWPAADRRRVVEAALWLVIVRLAFGLLPFKAALRLLQISPAETGTGRIAADEASEIGRAVVRAARRVPFRAVCLQQAFAALLMLRRRGLAGTVHLGVARSSDGLAAHAWSYCGDLPVTGIAAASGFVPVAVFAG